MLTLAPQIFANSAGPAPLTAGASGLAGNNNGQFESILQTILGTSATANSNGAQQTVPGLQNHFLGTQSPLAQLNAIMQKLGKALEANAQRSGAGQTDLVSVLQEALTPEEAALLQAALRSNSPSMDSPTANMLNLTDDAISGWTSGSSKEIDACLRVIEQIIAGITNILQQAGYGQMEQTVPGMEGQQALAGAEPEKMLSMLAQLRDTLQAAQAELMIKSEILTAGTEAGATISQPQPQGAEKVPVPVQPQALLTAAAQAETEPPKPLPLTLAEMLNLRLGPQSSDGEESPPATKAGADLLTVLKEGVGIATQGDLTGSGKQGSLLSQALQNKSMLGAYQQGSTARQPAAAFFSDLELLRVLSSHTDEAVREPQLTQLQFFAEADAKISAAGRPMRQPSAVQNIMPIDEGVQNQNGQSAKAEHAVKAPAAEQTSQPAILSQVADRIVAGIRRGESRLTLQIHPPSLGKVNIDLSIKNNQLRAIIIAETVQAKMLLDANLDQLKACLESQSLDVEKVSVEVGYDDRQFASTLREQRDRERRSMMSSADGIDESQRVRAEQQAAAMASAALYARGGSTVDLFA